MFTKKIYLINPVWYRLQFSLMEKLNAFSHLKQLLNSIDLRFASNLIALLLERELQIKMYIKCYNVDMLFIMHLILRPQHRLPKEKRTRTINKADKCVQSVFICIRFWIEFESIPLTYSFWGAYNHTLVLGLHLLLSLLYLYSSKSASL